MNEIQNDLRVPAELERNVFVTTIDKLVNWGWKRSIFPLSFGLACCAIEMITTQTSRHDQGRFGWEFVRGSARQADLMIVSGTVTKKMLPSIVRLWNQMSEPKYVIAMGACATSGGPFKEGYNVVSGIDKYLPVDVYITGCPPRPEALLHAFIKLQEKMERQSIKTSRWYRKSDSDGGAKEIPVPVLGPDYFHAGRSPSVLVMN